MDLRGKPLLEFAASEKAPSERFLLDRRQTDVKSCVGELQLAMQDRESKHEDRESNVVADRNSAFGQRVGIEKGWFA
jgi:hypothetical protein